MHNKKPSNDKSATTVRTRKIIKSSIAHELNTPLTYIKGNLELLKIELNGCSSRKTEEYIKAIQEGLERIAETVDVIKHVYSTAGDENIQNDSIE